MLILIILGASLIPLKSKKIAVWCGNTPDTRYSILGGTKGLYESQKDVSPSAAEFCAEPTNTILRLHFL
jgi:hypothetical protein